MNTDSEKLCLEEIDHLILDNDKKVTLANISNNWSIPNKDAEIVLEKWLKNYTGDKKIVKEYLIRGIDLKGNPIITVVPEKCLPKVDKICPNHTRILYSVEVSSINGKTLNIQEPSTNKYICLKITSDKRNVKINQIVVPPTEKSIKHDPEPVKKPTNIFGVVQSKQPKKEVKTENGSNNSSNDVKVKEEKTSPQKSPKKNQQKESAKVTKASQGKSSIASFFASKPSTSTGVSKVEKSISEAASKIEKVKLENVQPKKEPTEKKSNETKNSSKRPHSITSDSNEDSKSAEKTQKVQAKKKMKLEPTSTRVRLMQICDSSSDEEDASDRKDVKMDTDEENVVKKEKENTTPSPKKCETNKTNGSTETKKRRTKIKKMVTKTYEDEDGFINTVREMEEMSCSEEDEPKVAESKVAEPPAKKSTSVTNNSTSTAPKKKISPLDGKKQGTILSFFGKK